VDDPELTSGFAVRLMWKDNADNETCFGVAERIRGELIGVIGLSPGLAGWAIGPKSVEDIPDETGFHCYQVYYGNAAGLSYSNEACVDVEVLPVRLESTPLPPGCQGQGPMGAPGTPNPPENLRAEVVPGVGPIAGQVIRLTWDDNVTNDLCYTVEWTVGPEGAPGARYVWDRPPASVGPVFYEEAPYYVGTYCYRVQFGNEVGRSSYSNEACASVEAEPVWTTATPSPTPTPTPTPTPSPTPLPLPAACRGEGPVGAPGAPNPPTGFRAMLSSGSNVCEGFIVRLQWDDDADNELCHVIERKVGTDDWTLYQSSGPADPVSTGPVSVEDAPQRVGLHCYRVYYGNEGGRSAYSDEACVLVEVVPTMITPLFTSTPAPTRPPGCNLEGPVGSLRAPNAPSNLTAALRDEPGLPQPSFVDFAWDDNSTDEACFVMSFEGPWGLTEVIGPGQVAFSKAAYAERCGMAGYWCYHVSAANRWGMSQSSNEVCLTIESGVASPPAATAAVAQGAAVDAVPTTAGATDGGGLTWWWWSLVVAGSATALATAVGLVLAARRPSSR
jgi:hypothetical protein